MKLSLQLSILTTLILTSSSSGLAKEAAHQTQTDTVQLSRQLISFSKLPSLNKVEKKEQSFASEANWDWSNWSDVVEECKVFSRASKKSTKKLDLRFSFRKAKYK